MQRWEQIADYIDATWFSVPRTRQECIEQFQKPLVDPKQHAERVKQANQAPPPPVDGWTADQQKQLEEGIAGLPASMEKNEVVFHCETRSRASRSGTASRAF